MAEKHYILARVLCAPTTKTPKQAVELRHISSDGPPDVVAQVAAKEGFHLLYEMDRAPDMKRACELARANRLVTLDGVVKLWDLRGSPN